METLLPIAHYAGLTILALVAVATMSAIEFLVIVLAGNNRFLKNTRLVKFVLSPVLKDAEVGETRVRKQRSDWDKSQVSDPWSYRDADEELRIRGAFKLNEHDPFHAFPLFLELAEAGSVGCMNVVARGYHYGEGVTADEVRSREWYRRAALAGSQGAQLYMGQILLNAGDLDGAEEIFSVGVTKDWAPALYWMSRCQIKRSSSRASYLRVRPWLERASEQGSPYAQYLLGAALATGSFGQRDVLSGYRLIRKSLAQAHGSHNEEKRREKKIFNNRLRRNKMPFYFLSGFVFWLSIIYFYVNSMIILYNITHIDNKIDDFSVVIFYISGSLISAYICVILDDILKDKITFIRRREDKLRAGLSPATFDDVKSATFFNIILFVPPCIILSLLGIIEPWAR